MKVEVDELKNILESVRDGSLYVEDAVDKIVLNSNCSMDALDMQKERAEFESYGKNAVIAKLVDFTCGRYSVKETGTWHDIARSQNAAHKLNNDFDVWKAAKASAIPEGFVLVPKEPTDEMIDTGMNSFCFPLDNGRFYNHDLIFAYRAIIEASQEKCHDS